VAGRRARQMFDITAGFVYSQILYACVELDLFDKLVDGPLTAAELAGPMGMSEAAANRLLRAAVAVDLLERRGADRFGLGRHGIALPGNPGIAAMVKHHRMLYQDLADPLALFRGEVEQTQLGRYWSYAGSVDPAADGDDRVAEYSTLMTASTGFVAEDTLDAYPLRDHKCLMDVGGGLGHAHRTGQFGGRQRPVDELIEQVQLDAGIQDLRIDEAGGDVEHLSRAPACHPPSERKIRRPALKLRCRHQLVAPGAQAFDEGKLHL
jgi:hypothetical protein